MPLRPRIERAQVTGRVVRVDVAPAELSEAAVAHDVSADDHVAGLPRAAVRVGVHGGNVMARRYAIRSARRAYRVALEDVPSEVAAVRAGERGAVDLLPARPPDVGNPQSAVLAIERESPRVPKAEREDLVPPRLPDEGVAPRHS